MANRFSVEAVFKAVDRLTAPVTRMQNRVNKFTRSLTRRFHTLNRSVDKFTGAIKRGAVVAAASLATTSVAFANVIGVGARFEKTLVSAAVKFPGEIRKGTAAFEALEAAAREVGATTEFTASQSAEALNFLAMAGFDAEASVAALPGVVDLATAANSDLARATDVASDSLGAFGLMTSDVTKLSANLARINDVIVKTTTSANTTLDSFFETIKDGAPVATTAGASLETFSALAAGLAEAGIKGSRAGTTLKNIFLSLSAPTGEAAKVIQRLGLRTVDAGGNLRDIIDVFQDLDKSLEGLGTAQRSAVLERIFGKIPIAGVNNLLRIGSDRLREFRHMLEGASGASSEMADVIRNTLQGRIDSLNSAIEGVKLTLFSMTEGPLNDVVERMTAWVRANEKVIATRIGEFLAGIIDNFEAIVKWLKRIGISLAVFVTLVTILKSLALVLTVVNLLMAANPVGLIIVGILALTAALAASIVWLDELKEALSGIPTVTDLVVAAMKAKAAVMASLAGVVISAWQGVKKFFADMWAGIVSIFEAGVAKVVGLISTVGGAISSAASGIAGVGRFIGLGSDESNGVAANAVQSSVVSPEERIARSIEERSVTQSSEVTIRDETGRAELTAGTLGLGLTLQNSGAF